MAEVFAERLKSIRALRNLTQNELSERSGLPTSSIAQFETNARKPSFNTLRRLSMALEVSTDYLLGIVDEPKAAGSWSVLFKHFQELTTWEQEIIQDIITSMIARKKRKSIDLL